MSGSQTIAIDAMGGDMGPEMVVSSLDLIAARHPGWRFLLFGDQKKIEPLLSRVRLARSATEVRHSEISISMNDKPSQALRRGRGKSSMWHAIEAVRDSGAQVALSAGNTGALMAMATVILRTMPGVKRPAIAAIWPTLRGESVVLDVGATIGVDAEQLVSFAIMGEAMARCVFLIERPTVGLLNIGVEEVKGNEVVRDAGRILRQAQLPIEYYGFVEGDDMGKGTVDVVVTEGFTGNIALKTAEGTAKQLMAYLKAAMKRTMLSRLGAFLATRAFAALRDKMDPRRHNGGVFLGLNGIVVKSHGATDPFGFAAAADLAIEMARNAVIEKIAADLAALDATPPAVSEEPLEQQT
ncbi:MAG TPA: phosphate acyltransferase PlsX [Aestuariivirgaceae bacterium]|jgi:glycerol-3-phosphate acyltransferase PlsX